VTPPIRTRPAAPPTLDPSFSFQLAAVGPRLLDGRSDHLGGRRLSSWAAPPPWQQFATAGAADSPTKHIRFLRSQTLRVAGPLREMARHVETGPIPHAGEGLQQLLSVIADSQNVTRASRVNAIGNINILLELLDAVS
jgi:hypothetical protein